MIPQFLVFQVRVNLPQKESLGTRSAATDTRDDKIMQLSPAERMNGSVKKLAYSTTLFYKQTMPFFDSPNSDRKL